MLEQTENMWPNLLMKYKNYIKNIKIAYKKLNYIEQTLISKDKSPTDKRHATLNKGDEDISKAHSGSIQINGSFSKQNATHQKGKVIQTFIQICKKSFH